MPTLTQSEGLELAVRHAHDNGYDFAPSGEPFLVSDDVFMFYGGAASCSALIVDRVTGGVRVAGGRGRRKGRLTWLRRQR